MQLRNLFKCNIPNDGTRTLFESILVPEVGEAFKDWNQLVKGEKGVLIGGLALVYYVKPRVTTDADLLFITAEDIPVCVDNFKRTLPGVFTHEETNVEIKVLTPSSINFSKELARAIYENAIIEDGVRIASPSGLVASKLERFKLCDKADIQALYEISEIDLSHYPIPSEWLDKYEKLVNTF
jgi:hypothetical protein